MTLLSRLRAWLRPYPDDAEMQAEMLRAVEWKRFCDGTNEEGRRIMAIERERAKRYAPNFWRDEYL